MGALAEFAAAESENLVGLVGDATRVSDDDDDFVVFVGEVAEDFYNLGFGVFIEVAGGLVGHDDG